MDREIAASMCPGAREWVQPYPALAPGHDAARPGSTSLHDAEGADDAPSSIGPGVVFPPLQAVLPCTVV
ncbi:hypothetical protein AB4Z50_35945, partial [Paenibacillus sp. 2TAB26]|uniref:hypothetical protein n=1 Tax=Paenibacillus sp. 2TAB26 TaxID=3233005 RepID=UPI003F94A7D7